jgi:hypothetical protein
MLRIGGSMSVPNGLSCARYVPGRGGPLHPGSIKIEPVAVITADRKDPADRAATGNPFLRGLLPSQGPRGGRRGDAGGRVGCTGTPDSRAARHCTAVLHAYAQSRERAGVNLRPPVG